MWKIYTIAIGTDKARRKLAAECTSRAQATKVLRMQYPNARNIVRINAEQCYIVPQ